MIIKKAVYKTSVVDKKNLIRDDVPEFAFVGRSNVGKSSLINMLVNIKHLAKTSSTPGLTKMINYFDINDQFRFVDLPGYGFAKVGKGHLNVWAGLMEDYLIGSSNLETVFVLIDIRHEPNEFDKSMLEFLKYYQIPFIVIATKADKLSKAMQKKQINILTKALNLREDFIILTSSETALGKERILNYIENKLQMN